MKKLMYSLVALAALSSGAVWADAECQAGSAWGQKPGCGATEAPAPVAGNSGWTPPYGYDPGAGVLVYPPLAQGFPQVFSQQYPQQVYPQQVYPQYQAGSSVWVDPATGQQYSVRPSRRDRDGDGVPNNRDRYPDDPRFR